MLKIILTAGALLVAPAALALTPDDILGKGPVPSPSPLPSPGPIPEPGTWAMLIAGFGLVGASIRRRRAAQA